MLPVVSAGQCPASAAHADRSNPVPIFGLLERRTMLGQFALDGQTVQFEYTVESLLNGFPVHICLIVLFSLSTLYIIGWNLCCPPLFRMCSKERTIKVRQARSPPRSPRIAS